MNASPYIRSFGIGAVAGLRSMTAPAATLLASDSTFAGPAWLAAAGELVVDKLPLTPARTIPPALVARMISGGLCGGAVAKRRSGSRIVGIFAGAAGAVAATYLGFQIRQVLTKKVRLPDLAVALAEDALALWAARAANASAK